MMNIGVGCEVQNGKMEMRMRNGESHTIAEEDFGNEMR